MATFIWHGLEIDVVWDELNGQWLLRDVLIVDPAEYAEHVDVEATTNLDEYVLDNVASWEGDYSKAERDEEERARTWNADHYEPQD